MFPQLFSLNKVNIWLEMYLIPEEQVVLAQVGSAKQRRQELRVGDVLHQCRYNVSSLLQAGHKDKLNYLTLRRHPPHHAMQRAHVK